MVSDLSSSLVLYSTIGCHLCEQALELIGPLLGSNDDIEEIDISDSDALMERYGIRIPVIVRCDTHAELGWPFGKQQFVDFMAG